MPERSDQPAATPCEFVEGHRRQPVVPESVATVTMPENAPKQFVRVCAHHARRLREIGEQVEWDAGRWPRELERPGGCDCCLSDEKPVVMFRDGTASCETCWTVYVEAEEDERAKT